MLHGFETSLCELRDAFTKRPVLMAPLASKGALAAGSPISILGMAGEVFGKKTVVLFGKCLNGTCDYANERGRAQYARGMKPLTII